MDLGHSADERAFRNALPLIEDVVDFATASVRAEAVDAITSRSEGGP
jgi:hypothetical protein